MIDMKFDISCMIDKDNISFSVTIMINMKLLFGQKVINDLPSNKYTEK